MRQQAQQIRAYAQQDNEIMSRLTNLVLGMDDIWKGRAQEEFVQKYRGMMLNILNLEEALVSYADVMESDLRKMEEADRQIKAKMRR